MEFNILGKTRGKTQGEKKNRNVMYVDRSFIRNCGSQNFDMVCAFEKNGEMVEFQKLQLRGKLKEREEKETLELFNGRY